MNANTPKKSRTFYANTASTAAIVLALAGTGGAAYAAGLAKDSVGSPQIKTGAVKTKELAKNAVKGPKVKNGTLSAADLNGAANEKFTAGPTAYYDHLEFHDLSSGDPDTTIFEITVPDGAYAVSASGTIQNTGPDTNDFSCSITQPVGDEFTNTIATSEVRVDNGGDLGTIALDGVAINSANGNTITMTCEGQLEPYAGKILDPRIVLVELGEAVEK